MFELFLISIIFVGIALLGLSVKLLLKRGGKFPETHISHNKEMRNKGIYCYHTQEKVERNKSAAKANGEDREYTCGCEYECDGKIC